MYRLKQQNFNKNIDIKQHNFRLGKKLCVFPPLLCLLSYKNKNIEAQVKFIGSYKKRVLLHYIHPKNGIKIKINPGRPGLKKIEL